MGRKQWIEAEYEEDTTSASWKEIERERAVSSESTDGRRGRGEEQMCEVSRSDTG